MLHECCRSEDSAAHGRLQGGTDMYTTSIEKLDGIAYSGLRTDNKAADSATAKETAAERTAARRATMYTGSNTMAGIARQVETALANVQPDSNGRITFQQVADHKKKLENDFAEEVKKDLRALGVDENIEFRLVSVSGGGISVLSDHEDAAMVERYFKANPEMVERFNQIETLGNFDRARQFQNRPITDMRREIQMQGVEVFMSAAQGNGMSLASELMDFSASGYSAGMFGLNLTV